MTPPRHAALDAKTDAELLKRFEHMLKHAGESTYYDRELGLARAVVLARMGNRTPHRLKLTDPVCCCTNGHANSMCPVHWR